MALSTAQQIRLRVQDAPRIADVVRYGDGSASAFDLQHVNVISASAFVMVSAGGTPPTGWSATGATFNASGYVTFSGVPSANSALKLRYVYSTFSDDEIDHFQTAGGNINGAALEAVQTLMFDGLKRSKWAAPDGSEYSDVDAMKLLTDMYDRFKKEELEDGIAGGGFGQWAITQSEV